MAEVTAISALLQAVDRQRPDVVVIDVNSPSRDTLEQLADRKLIDRAKAILMRKAVGEAHSRNTTISSGVPSATACKVVQHGKDADRHMGRRTWRPGLRIRDR